MCEVILHERAWVEDALRNLSLGKKPVATIFRLAKYYYAEGYKKQDVRRMLEDFIIKCDPNANIVKWQDAIDSVVSRADKSPLIEIDGVTITKAEIESIQKLNGKMSQKLMFTLLCLAKYGNALRPNNNNWVNREARDIFSAANIAVTCKRQSLMINDLWRHGYIGYSRVIDNVSLNVRIVDNDSEPAITITDFRNLGNQYLMFIGENYMACQDCGLVIRRTMNGQKRCRVCAAEANRRNARERYRDTVA